MQLQDTTVSVRKPDIRKPDLSKIRTLGSLVIRHVARNLTCFFIAVKWAEVSENQKIRKLENNKVSKYRTSLDFRHLL